MTSNHRVQGDPDRSRRLPEWDLESGPGNYLAQVYAQGASAVLAFVAMWLATRLLGLDGYGRLVAVFAASQCVGQITLHWSAVSVVRFGVEEFVRTGRIANAFWHRLFILAVNLVIVLGSAVLWLPLLSDWLQLPAELWVFVIAYLLVVALWIHVQQALQAAKLPRWHGGLLTLERAGLVVLLCVEAVSGTVSLIWVAFAYLAGACIACAVGTWRVRALIWPPPRVSGSDLKRIAMFSTPLIMSSVTGFFATSYLDAFFILKFLSASKLAVYSVVYQLSGISMQLPLLAGYLLGPFFVTAAVSGRDDWQRRFLSQVLPLTTLLWSVACSIVAVVVPPLLPAIFGREFVGARELVWPLMATAAVAAPYLIGYVAITNANSATYVVATGAATSAVLNVALDVVLIPRFGLLGCAWATLIATGAGVLVVDFLVRRRVVANDGWVSEALLPVALGAAWASWSGQNVNGLLVSTVAAAAVAFRRRRAVGAAIVVLRAAGVAGSVRGWWRRPA